MNGIKVFLASDHAGYYLKEKTNRQLSAPGLKKHMDKKYGSGEFIPVK